MKIKVNIILDEEQGYSTKTIASASIDSTIVIDGFDKRKLRQEVENAIEDASDRIDSQLNLIDKQKKAEAAAAAADSED